jgi:hypothetical protein
MSTIAQVSTALAATLDDTGIRVFDYVPDDVNPPVLFLSLDEVQRSAMGRGTMMLTYSAVLLVARASDRVGQAEIYKYAEPSTSQAKSVWAAVDENRGLGLGDADANVVSWRQLGIDEVAGYGYFGGVFEIQVATSGV